MEEKVVLITGASRGFGEAAARRIAGRGHTVVATMREPERDGGGLAAAFPGLIHPMRLDVTLAEDVEAAVRSAIERFGRIDVLVNNAGYGLYGPAEDFEEDEVWRQIDTNVLGQWRMARAVLPAMRARRFGKIVNVSSLAGRVPGAWLGMYAASKHAVEGMSESLRFEVAHLGVEVCILEPGMFASDWQTGSLDVCRTVRDGKSPYQEPVSAALEAFRGRAATRPGSSSVGAAIADMVDLQQPLPMRWPVGDDSVHMLEARGSTTEAEWDQLRRSGSLRSWRRPGQLPEADRWSWERDNVVLITGASRGFGAAAAKECAARGNKVVATMRDPGRDAGSVVEGFGGQIEALELDVTQPSSVSGAVATVLERHGRIDVLVNNAGYGLYGPLEDLSEGEVQKQFDTNFVGQWRMMKAVLAAMRLQQHGKIINVSSLSGEVPEPITGMYAASKHAVEGLSESMIDEVASFGVQISILQPGMYRSDLQTTNLDVCQSLRTGSSAYQRGVERALREFRDLAATRPGSDAVAAAIADIVQLQQQLPVRWPVGEDCLRLIRLRRSTLDDEWEAQMRAEGWGFGQADLKD